MSTPDSPRAVIRWEPDTEHPDGGYWIEYEPPVGHASTIREEPEPEESRIGFRRGERTKQRIGFRQ